MMMTRGCMRACMQLADALECMHRYSLLHRDIKAENIVFKDTAAAAAAKKVPPVVKFIDLGMATLYDKSKPQTGAAAHLARWQSLLTAPSGLLSGTLTHLAFFRPCCIRHTHHSSKYYSIMP